MNTATQPAKICSFDSTKTDSALGKTNSFRGWLTKIKNQIGTGCRIPEHYLSMNHKQHLHAGYKIKGRRFVEAVERNQTPERYT